MSKELKVKPCFNQIYIKMEEAHAGVLDTSSRESAIENAIILAIGEGVTGYKKGDVIFVKSWAVDSIYYKDKRYNFIDVTTGGIKAVLE